MQPAAQQLAETWWEAALIALAQGGPSAIILALVAWLGFKLAMRLAEMIGASLDKMSSSIAKLSDAITHLVQAHSEHAEEIREHVTDESNKTRDLVRERTREAA